MPWLESVTWKLHAVGSLSRGVVMTFGRRGQWDDPSKMDWVGIDVLGKPTEVLEHLVDTFTKVYSRLELLGRGVLESAENIVRPW